jgi:branched-chain amino acid transport system permease protein
MRANGSRDILIDLAGAAAILAAGAAAYFLFSDNLAFPVRIITAALLVLSLDLVTGYSGIATLGHAVLFGAGAYAAGIANVHGIHEPLAMLAIGVFAGMAAGLISGVVIARVSGLAQLVLSIAIVQFLQAAANKASWLTGGSDGLSGIDPAPIAGMFAFDLYGHSAFFLSLSLLTLTFLVLRRLVRSPFGLLCRAIKDDPLRVAAIGASAYPALVKMYAISGAVAGLGGALAAITTGVVGLDSLSFERSASTLVMLALGGTGTLFGGLLGTGVYELVEHFISAANPFHWLIFIGVLLIAVVLFLPRGLQSAFWLLPGLKKSGART